MKPNGIRLSLLVAAVLQLTSITFADTLTPGGWQTFTWNTVNPSDIPQLVLNLSGKTGLTELRIVDAYAAGDMFQVTISNGSSLSLFTSSVPNPQYAAQVWGMYEAAWRLEGYHSRLSVWLEGGKTYYINIAVTQSAKSQVTGSPMTWGTAYIGAFSYSGVFTNWNLASSFVSTQLVGPTPFGCNKSTVGENGIIPCR